MRLCSINTCLKRPFIKVELSRGRIDGLNLAGIAQTLRIILCHAVMRDMQRRVDPSGVLTVWRNDHGIDDEIRSFYIKYETNMEKEENYNER